MIACEKGESLIAYAGKDKTLKCTDTYRTVGGADGDLVTSDGATYQWTTTDGHIRAGADEKVAEVDKAGTYTLTVSKAGSESATDSAVITQEQDCEDDETEDPDNGCGFNAAAGDDISIDNGESTQLNASPTGTTSGKSTTRKNLTFDNGFENGNADWTDSGPWRKVPANVVSANEGREGSKSVRFLPLSNQKRSEFVLQNGKGSYEWGKEYWVGFSTKMIKHPTGFRIVSQHHSTPNKKADGSGSDWSCGAGPNSFTIKTVDGNFEIRTSTIRGNVNTTPPIGSALWGTKTVTKPYQLNKWYDFVLHFKYAPDNTGYIEVWMNGNKVLNVKNSPTVYKLDRCGKPRTKVQYQKIGMYYGTGNQGGEILYDAFRIGNSNASYEDVAPGDDGGNNDPAPTYTHEWKPSTGLSDANIANPVASPEKTTTYTLTVTDSNGCTSTDKVKVTVKDVVVTPVILIVNAGRDKILRCTTSTGNYRTVGNEDGNPGTSDEAVYEWTTEEGNIRAGADEKIAEVDKAGTYTLTVSKVGSVTVTDTVVITLDKTCAKTTNASGEKVVLYPNPTNGVITLENLDTAHLNMYSILDMTGRVMQSGILDKEASSLQIDLGNLRSGIYLIQVNQQLIKVIRR